MEFDAQVYLTKVYEGKNAACSKKPNLPRTFEFIVKN